MATVLDTKFRALAEKLINKNGLTVTILSGGVNGDEYDIKGFIENYNLNEVDNALIKRNDIKLLLAQKDVDALGIEIDNNDLIRINGKASKIIDIQDTYSGEQVALKTLQVRR